MADISPVAVSQDWKAGGCRKRATGKQLEFSGVHAWWTLGDRQLQPVGLSVVMEKTGSLLVALHRAGKRECWLGDGQRNR